MGGYRAPHAGSPSCRSRRSPRDRSRRRSRQLDHANCAELADGDIVVVTSKIVSKAEGRTIELDSVDAVGRSPNEWAVLWNKDPRIVEVVLRESKRIVRQVGPVLITETHHGFVCANAGVDQSSSGAPDRVVVLPLDPDGSARRLRDPIRRARRRRGGDHQRHVRTAVARGADRRRDRRRRASAPLHELHRRASTRTATSSGSRSCASPTSWPAPPNW